MVANAGALVYKYEGVVSVEAGGWSKWGLLLVTPRFVEFAVVTNPIAGLSIFEGIWSCSGV